MRSTPHRVLNVVDDRISLPLFVHPNWDAVITPTPLPGARGGSVTNELPSLTTREFMTKWHDGELNGGGSDQLSKL